jgi:inosine/xanthosine triphosphate pyrophosphatase family protein
LNNFPGALLKFAISTVGAKGIVKLMEKQNGRTAVFEMAVAFMSSDLEKPIVFKSLEKGSILKDVRKGKLRGWTDIIRVFSSPSFQTKLSRRWMTKNGKNTKRKCQKTTI